MQFECCRDAQLLNYFFMRPPKLAVRRESSAPLRVQLRYFLLHIVIEHLAFHFEIISSLPIRNI